MGRNVDRLKLMETLRSFPHTPDWWNPWFDEDAAGEKRRSALRDFLTERSDAPVLLIGNAPGHRGARLTGIPFTDPASDGEGIKEESATRVHQVLRMHGMEAKTLLWNIFPFHPHLPGVPGSNRPLRRSEETQLAALVHMFAPSSRRLVIAVGKPAERGMASIGYRVPYVRHPGNGGAKLFEEGMALHVAVMKGN